MILISVRILESLPKAEPVETVPGSKASETVIEDVWVDVHRIAGLTKVIGSVSGKLVYILKYALLHSLCVFILMRYFTAKSALTLVTRRNWLLVGTGY